MVAWWSRVRLRLQRALTGDEDTRIGWRMRLPLVWVIALAALALLLPARLWTTLLVGILGLLVVALFWSRQLARGLGAERRLSYGWVSVGDRLEEQFALVNHSGLPALWVEITDDSNVPGYAVSSVRAVDAGETSRWRQSSVCRQRGQYRLGPWEIESGDPFGIFRVRRRYAATQEIIIHPPIHANLPIPLPPGQLEGRTRAQDRAWQATANAATVRDYHHLDPYHWIHWPTSARRDALYVRQFERDASGDVWLVIDGQAAAQLGEGADGTEEHAVLLAASLAARAARERRPVGLAAFGREPRIVPPSTGEGQQWAILRALALLRADGDVALGRALRELSDTVRRGAAAVIITPSAAADWIPQLVTLSRRGIDSRVLLLDRVSFGGEGGSEALQQTLHRLGVRCQIVRRGELGQPVADEEHRGFWEFKVTGTGKAVAVRNPFEAGQR